MRWALVLLVATGCSKLFGLSHVDPGTTQPDAPRPVDALVDAPGPHICISDNFDTGGLNNAVFSIGSPPQGGGTQASSGGVLMTWVAGKMGDNYGRIETKNMFDLTGGDVSVDVDDFTGDQAEAELYVVIDPSHDVLITVNATTIEYDVYNGSTTAYASERQVPFTSFPVHLTISVDPTGQQLTFAASTSGGSDSLPIPAPFGVHAIVTGFSAGTYDVATNNGAAQFDNFVLRSPTCL